MRVLWISFLLIGSITCVPVGKGSGSSSADTSNTPLSFPAFFWDSGRGESSDRGSSSPLPSLPNQSPNMAEGPNSYGGYASFGAEVYTSPEVTEYGVADPASPAGGYGGYGGYGGSAPAGGYGGYYASPYEGDGSYGYASAPRDENSSSGSATNYGVSEESPEPVFSDVSDLEPVYSFRSRSSYQRGRAVFAQSRYTPGESVLPPMPVYKPISRTPSKQSSPAKAPTKGGF